MSQEKVDRYKEEKKNRKEIMRKEKLRHRASIAAFLIILVALVGWFGFAVYRNLEGKKLASADVKKTEWNLDAYNEYTSQLNTYVTEQRAAASSASEAES